MPWTPAQIRLFRAQYNRGELSKAELDRRLSEGTRSDVDKTGHAKKRAKKKAKRSTRKKRAGRAAPKRSKRKTKRAHKRKARRKVKRTTRR